MLHDRLRAFYLKTIKQVSSRYLLIQTMVIVLLSSISLFLNRPIDNPSLKTYAGMPAYSNSDVPSIIRDKNNSNMMTEDLMMTKELIKKYEKLIEEITIDVEQNNLKMTQESIEKYEKLIKEITIDVVLSNHMTEELIKKYEKLIEEVSTTNSRLQELERIILDDPQKALSIPLMQKDLTNMRTEIINLRLEINKMNEQQYWVLGIIITIVIGFVSLIGSIFINPWKSANKMHNDLSS